MTAVATAAAARKSLDIVIPTVLTQKCGALLLRTTLGASKPVWRGPS
jgi:hypothetical protein